jgi:hypothetical protein
MREMLCKSRKNAIHTYFHVLDNEQCPFICPFISPFICPFICSLSVDSAKWFGIFVIRHPVRTAENFMRHTHVNMQIKLASLLSDHTSLIESMDQ